MEHHQLFVKIEKAFPECDEEECLKIYENVLRCVGNKRYVCPFLLNFSYPSVLVLNSWGTFWHVECSSMDWEEPLVSSCSESFSAS